MTQFTNNFLFHLYDIDPKDEFTFQFIHNNSLNLDKVIKHPLLKLNTVYTWVYHEMLGIYPTKKCFSSWYAGQDTLPNEYDFKFLEKILTEFIPLKLGLISILNINEFSEKYQNFIQHLSPEIIKKQTILKWEHRFQTKIDNHHENLAVIYKFLRNKKTSNNDVHNIQLNPITQYYNLDISFTDHELTCMNAPERIQHIHSQDNHWLVNSIGSGCIIYNLSRPNRDILHNTIQVLENITQKNVTIYHLIRNFSEKLTDNLLFKYEIPESYLSLIPKVHSHCVIINNDPELPLVSLSQNPPYHLFFGNSIGNIQKKYPKIYHIDNKLESLRHNTLCGGYTPNSVPNKIYLVIKWHIAPKSRADLDHETWFTTLSHVPASQADLLIDLYDEIPPESYIINGTIPIVKAQNPWILHEITGFYVENSDDVDKLLLRSRHEENRVILEKMQRNCRMTRNLLESDTWKFLLKQHLLFGHQKDSPQGQNSLIYYNFINHYFRKNLIDIINLVPSKNPTYYAITVDSRPSPATVLSAVFALINLGPNWKLKIFVNKKVYQWYSDRLGNLAEIQILNQLEISHFHIDYYNKLLKCGEFWNQIPAKKCLIIQDDGILLRKGIDEWLDYDYVGAPWLDCSGNKYIKDNIYKELVGNGGLSLRNVEMMKTVCEKFDPQKLTLFFHNINQVPEDCYFVDKVLKLGGKIPGYKKASYFSMEQIYNKKSLAVHKCWGYLSRSEIYEYFQQILDE